MPQPLRMDWELVRGQDFAETVQWINGNTGDPQDLTGYTARMQVKAASGGAALATLTTENGGITIEAAEGRVSIHIVNATTAAFPVATLEYDLFLINADGERDAFIRGQIVVRSAVTTFS